MNFTVNRQNRSATQVAKEALQDLATPGLIGVRRKSTRVPTGLMKHRTMVDSDEEFDDLTNPIKSSQFQQVFAKFCPKLTEVHADMEISPTKTDTV